MKGTTREEKGRCPGSRKSGREDVQAARYWGARCTVEALEGSGAGEEGEEGRRLKGKGKTEGATGFEKPK